MSGKLIWESEFLNPAAQSMSNPLVEKQADQPDPRKGARTILETLMNVRAGENVSIVSDTNKLDVARILMTEATAMEATVSLCVMTPQAYNGEEPPLPIAAAMKASDVILSPTTKVLSHTRARFEAQAAGARFCLMSDYTVEMLTRGGLNADLRAVKANVEKLAGVFGRSKRIRIKTAAGTDLTASVDGRRANAYHGFAHQPGTYSLCQCQEANISPIEGTAEGTIVVDGAVAGWLLIKDQPIVVRVQEGRIAAIEGGKEAETLRNHLAMKEDDNIYNLAEIGVGLNPECRLIGNVLEDEGILGTAHIGIGSSITLGGEVHARGHEDLVVWNPTVEADGRVVQTGKELFF
jgi:2,5-dihydroxypyridine 5,6-dioxygenase